MNQVLFASFSFAIPTEHCHLPPARLFLGRTEHLQCFEMKCGVRGALHFIIDIIAAAPTKSSQFT